MKAFQIQLQPTLSPVLDVAEVIARLSEVGQPAGAQLKVTEGVDDGRYVNLDFRANDPGRLWSAVQRELCNDRDLAKATIVCCEGPEGWDDYLLLHHFDATERLDLME